MLKKTLTYIFIIVLCLFISGCTTTGRAINEARDTIRQLEQSDAERAARNIELEELYKSERTGNTELKKIISDLNSKLNGYFESERLRIESERLIADRFEGIFSEGQSIIEELREGLNGIRESTIQVKEME